MVDIIYQPAHGRVEKRSAPTEPSDKNELSSTKHHDFGNYQNDYILERAVDLVKGIYLYNEQGTEKNE